MGEVRQLKREGRTIILTTHYMDEAEQLCDRLVIMERGKFLVEGEPKRLIADVVGDCVMEVIETDGDEAERYLQLPRTAGGALRRSPVRVFERLSDHQPGIPEASSGNIFVIRPATLEDLPAPHWQEVEEGDKWASTEGGGVAEAERRCVLQDLEDQLPAFRVQPALPGRHGAGVRSLVAGLTYRDSPSNTYASSLPA